MAGFFKKTAQSASIETRYLEGKARGFKHAPEVGEQLEIFKIQIAEVKKIKKTYSTIEKEQKELFKAEEKASKEFTDHSSTENQNPKSGTVFKMFADCQSNLSSCRSGYVNTYRGVLEDWKILTKQDFGKVDKMLDHANRTLVTRQYYESNRDYINAKNQDEKYSQQIIEVVHGIHEFREKKEELHPQFLLRCLQADIFFWREALRHVEQCEEAIRRLGPVEPIRFVGFTLESKEYAVPESSKQGTVNHVDPYAGYGYSQPTAQPVVVQQPVVIQQTTTSYVQPVVPPPVVVQQRVMHVRGLYAFQGSTPQELSFNPGDVMVLISQDGAWWTAEMNGRRGFIPSNYVELLQ